MEYIYDNSYIILMYSLCQIQIWERRAAQEALKKPLLQQCGARSTRPRA